MARALTLSAPWTLVLSLSVLVVCTDGSGSSSSLTGDGLALCVSTVPVAGTSRSSAATALPRDCKPVLLEQQAGCVGAAQTLLQKCQLLSTFNLTGDLRAAVETTATVVPSATSTPADSSATTILPGTCHEVEYVVRQRLCDDGHMASAEEAQEGADGVEHDDSAAKRALPKSPSARQTANYKWAGAIGSVAVISIAGFVILSVVPALSKFIYTSLLQFLVALAIGTLVGDAVLHLLPHAMLNDIHGGEHAYEADGGGHGHGHGHSLNEEEGSRDSPYGAVTWRASMALVGVLIFYNAERLLGVLAQKKAKPKQDQLPHQPQSCNDECDARSTAAESCTGGEVGMAAAAGHGSTEMKSMVKALHESLHALGGFPCPADAPAAATVAERQDMSFGAEPLLGALALESLGALDTASAESCDGKIRPTASGKQPKSCPLVDPWARCHHHQHPTALGEVSEKQLLAAAGSRDPAAAAATSAAAEAMLGRGDIEGHGHSHHFHPSSLSSVAYMVVAGDGMHNFTDGLAIGVAFSGSLAGGLATALAVLCHELPHELGDFAMLLKAGMTIKQAFLCNVISAALCLVGSIIGVAVGSVTSGGEQWLFGLCGGIFLYIALVDMMPEISRVDKKRPFLQLLIQDLGLLTGFCIMLTIALFEHRIEKAIMWHLSQH